MALPALKEDPTLEEGFYGWRPRRRPDGTVELTPRTLEEFLDPQEGDQMSQDSWHSRMMRILSAVFERLFPVGSDVTVFADLRVEFRNPALPAAVPDVCLIRGVEDPGKRRKSFYEGREPGEILLTVEIVSPERAFKDYEHDVQLYAAAGVPEYLIVDRRDDGDIRIEGFRLRRGAKQYQRIPVQRGRIPLRTAGVQVAPDPDGWGLRIVNAATGDVVLSLEEALEAAERRAEAEAQRADALAEENERLRKVLAERS